MRVTSNSCAIDGAGDLAAILNEARQAFLDTLDHYSLADAVVYCDPNQNLITDENI